MSESENEVLKAEIERLNTQIGVLILTNRRLKAVILHQQYQLSSCEQTARYGAVGERGDACMSIDVGNL